MITRADRRRRRGFTVISTVAIGIVVSLLAASLAVVASQDLYDARRLEAITRNRLTAESVAAAVFATVRSEGLPVTDFPGLATDGPELRWGRLGGSGSLWQDCTSVESCGEGDSVGFHVDLAAQPASSGSGRYTVEVQTRTRCREDGSRCITGRFQQALVHRHFLQHLFVADQEGVAAAVVDGHLSIAADAPGCALGSIPTGFDACAPVAFRGPAPVVSGEIQAPDVVRGSIVSNDTAIAVCGAPDFSSSDARVTVTSTDPVPGVGEPAASRGWVVAGEALPPEVDQDPASPCSTTTDDPSFVADLSRALVKAGAAHPEVRQVVPPVADLSDEDFDAAYRAIAAQGGYLLTPPDGVTSAVILVGDELCFGSSSYGYSGQCPDGASLWPLPPNGVVYSPNPVVVGAAPGTPVEGKVTVVSAQDVVIGTDLRVSATDSVAEDNPNFIGVLAGRDVRVGTEGASPGMTRTVQAALVARRQVKTDSWGTPGPPVKNPPTLRLVGAVASKVRAVVAGYDDRTGLLVAGYRKDWSYDRRLADRQPPFLLGPEPSGWSRLPLADTTGSTGLSGTDPELHTPPTPDLDLPETGAPLGVSAVPFGDQMRVAWAPPASGDTCVLRYDAYRTENGGPATLSGSVAADQTHTYQTVTAAKTYRFAVSAVYSDEPGCPAGDRRSVWSPPVTTPALVAETTGLSPSLYWRMDEPRPWWSGLSGYAANVAAGTPEGGAARSTDGTYPADAVYAQSSPVTSDTWSRTAHLPTDGVTSGSFVATTTKELSVAMWAKVPPATGNVILAARTNLGVGKNPELVLFVNPALGQVGAFVGALQMCATAEGVIRPNRWHYYVATAAAGMLRVYVDGTLRSICAVTPTDVPEQAGTFVAGGAGATVGEVALFPAALSSAQVEALYAASGPDAPEGGYAASVLRDSPRGFWRLADAGTTAADASSNQADGTYAASGITRNLPGPFTGSVGVRVDSTAAPAVTGFGVPVASTDPDEDVWAWANSPGVVMESWVHLPSASKHGEIVRVGRPPSQHGLGMGIGDGSYTVDGNHLIVLWEVVCWIDSGVNVGTGWHHIAVAVTPPGPSGKTVTEFYIDGEMVKSVTGCPTNDTRTPGSDRNDAWAIGGTGTRAPVGITIAEPAVYTGGLLWGVPWSRGGMRAHYRAGAGLP